MSKKAELAILAAGLICLVLFAVLPLFFPDIEALPTNYLRNLRLGAGTFYGATATDIVDCILGMRGLASGGDPYPLLGPAVKELGLEWNLNFHSLRPPTAFLFTAPVAFLPWRVASPLWALLMILCWILALRLLNLSWNLSFGIGGLLLLWPPAALSLGQLTAPMLLFLMLAYAWKERPSGIAGAAIAISAMAKYTPATALINFVKSPNRWRTLFAFGLAWGITLGITILLNPAAIPRYIQVNQGISLGTYSGPAPLSVGWEAFGWFGVAGWLIFVAIVIFRNWRWIAENTIRGWMVSIYLSVALLPLVWIYSLLVLLPLVWYLLFKSNHWLGQLLILAALLLTFITPGYGPGAIPYISGTVLLAGLALLP
jgi:hypothetical protein